MNIVGRIWNRAKLLYNLALNDPKAWNPSLWRFKGAISESGEDVTEETALTYSAVWCAVALIASTVSTLPLHLMQRRGKTKRIADNDPLYYVMHDRWNPFMTAQIGRECMMQHILTWGNGYAEKVLNGYGEVTALWPIPPNRVLRIEPRGEQLWYEIKLDAASIWMPREKILHIAGLGFDGYVGYSPIAMARKSIGLGMAMETFGSKYFGDGTHPGVIVSHPGPGMSPQAHANLRQALTETYSGLSKSHRLMLLEEGMKIEKVTIPPDESQFLESRQFQIPEIARWFNLPPHKLKDLTKSSFNNIEQEQISFVTDSILPWLIRLESQMNVQLLTEGQRRTEKLYFKHNMAGLLRGDAKSRAEFYQIMINAGIMTRNEAREKEDLDPVSNPLADELFIMTNLWPLSQFEQFMKQYGKKGVTEGGDKNTPNALRLLKEGNR